MKNILFSIFLSCFCIGISQAQEMGYGFKAGLNFSTINGPSEQTVDGSDTEMNEYITGFHIAAIINFKLTDIAGVRTELMFSQKGSRYTFEGDSYQDFFNNSQVTLTSTTGMKELSINTTNAYIDIPVMGYFRATDWLEISGGASVGVLVSSVAAGELRYSGVSASGTPLDDVVIGIEYNYLTDDINTQSEDFNTKMVGNQTLRIPRTVGAYYDYNLYNQELQGNFYNRLDLGLVGGINIFLNQGLSLGLRVNYGLSDITNNEVDPSIQSLDEDGNFIYLEDKDTNLSLQASIGFSF